MASEAGGVHKLTAHCWPAAHTTVDERGGQGRTLSESICSGRLQHLSKRAVLALRKAGHYSQEPGSSLGQLWARNTADGRTIRQAQEYVGPDERALGQNELWAVGLTDKEVSLTHLECSVSTCPKGDKGPVFIWSF